MQYRTGVLPLSGHTGGKQKTVEYCCKKGYIQNKCENGFTYNDFTYNGFTHSGITYGCLPEGMP